MRSPEAADTLNRPIKIVRIINRLSVGGPTIHVTLLTSGLNDGQMESILVTGPVGGSEGDMTYYAEQRDVPVTVINEMRRSRSLLSPLKDAVALFKLYRLLRRQRPQVVHTHTAIGGLLGRVAAVLAGVPIRVHTFHGHVFDGYYSRPVALLFIWLERFLARFTQRIVVVSESQARDLSGRYRIAHPEKFVVIPLGFDLDIFQPSASARGHLRRELGIPADFAIVGSVGRLTSIKNLGMLLRAAAQVTQVRPNMAFVVVGDGEERERLARLAAELAILDQVYFVGWRRDMAVVYADLDILALTSLNEGTPATLIEAMASGVPVIATAVGGVPDIVRDGVTGRLVPSEDEEALAQALLALLADPQLRRRMSDAARAEATARFSKERLVADMRNLYVQLLTQRGLLP